MAYELTQVQPAQITVVCGGPWCVKLSTEVVDIFRAAKWQTKFIKADGFGVQGLSGIRADSCGFQANKLRDFLQWATTRKVNVVDEGACKGDRSIYLVIGEPEF